MARHEKTLTGIERTFPADEIIVSKTDPTGRLTYVNDIFIGISGYSETELLGQQHSVIRHPCMPRCVFRLLWQRIGAGHEVFAYINNRSKNGDHYWVLAHVTPNVDGAGRIVGFHSNRRVPRRDALEQIEPLYGKLAGEEARPDSRKDGLNASAAMLDDFLASKGVGYDRFVLGV